MKILRLEASNVKRLRAIDITPQGNTIVIGGRNGQGKTSALDAIAYTLGGEKLCPAVPIRKGEASAHVTIELDDLMVRRTWTDKGSYLTVTTKDGARFPSPQAILDKMVGRLTFDPLEFLRDKPKDQLVTLRDLCGLDFRQLDGQRQRIYEERTDKGRELKVLEAQISSMPKPAIAGPLEPVDVDAFDGRLREAAKHNEGVMAYEGETARQKDALAHSQDELKRWQKDLEEARQKVRVLELSISERAEEIRLTTKEMVARVEASPVGVDLAPIQRERSAAAAHNRRLEENDAWIAKEAQVSALREAVREQTRAIEKIDAEKRAAIASADYPIRELSINDDGVLYGGLPLEQASSAEQLRISVAMGLALNPQLRVLLIRDGSLLDEESLAAIARMADEQDAQVWIERVGDGEEVQVLIEDGAVVGAKPTEDRQ